MMHGRWWVQGVCVGLLAFAESGCTSMVPIEAQDAAAMLEAVEAGDFVCVLDSGGATTRLEVTSVGVSFIEGLTDRDEPVRIAATEVRQIRERRVVPGKTIALGVGVGILLSGLSLWMTGFDLE